MTIADKSDLTLLLSISASILRCDVGETLRSLVFGDKVPPMAPIGDVNEVEDEEDESKLVGDLLEVYRLQFNDNLCGGVILKSR